MGKKVISIVTLSVFIGIISSCGFNKAFLKPIPYPTSTEQTSFTIQNDNVVVAFEGDNKQPTYIRNGTDTVEFIYDIESVFFSSESGNSINGWWLTPKEVEPKITLIHFHGNSGSLPFQHFATTKMIEYGIQVFAIDYSGFGFSEGKAKRKSVIKDGNSAVDYVANHPKTKGTKVIIYGQSLGGNLAGVVASENNDNIDGVVMEGAFSSHKEIASRFAGFIGRWFVKEQYSSAQSIGKFHKPVLVIHSNEDDVIPIKEGREIYDNANQPKEFYEIDGCHICGSRDYAEEIAQKIFKMLGLD